MADSDFGQLWAELVLQNNVSPQLEQIIKDFQLVDNSIRETRKHLEAFADVKLTNSINDVEKNWRSMRGAISDVQTDIDKLRIKMANLNDAGFGNSSEYKKYEDSLKKLIALKYEMLDMGKNGQTRASILGSEDVTRFKQELSLSRKEIANTDVAAKHLVDTQRQNVGAVEKMVSQYDKMLTTLKSVRQEALDSGMTTMGTQWLQNTINRIQAVSDALRQALNNPSSITNNMVQQAEQQFSSLEQMAKNHAGRIRNTLTAKQLMDNSQLELTKMETHLERIKNKLAGFREDKKITVNTTDLDTARQKLDDFLNRYRSILNSGNISKTTAKNLAAEFNQIAAEAELAEAKVKGLYEAEKRRLGSTASPAKPIVDTANALRDAQSAFDPIIQKMQQLQSATTRTGVIWEQFKTQIAFTAFSIYGMEHFLKSIITVGGEFERQRVALQNMLGDMREATEIFSQLKNLALESPFTFRQLSTYTKQLAAFSIPYEELYDTNRRLSDMSAGLGVDMSRLILAYGQVRAATVLRGQELRQFTEAGVPMVEKLADYFTKLNGELVTTREIFTMISKKQVPFEAVRAVMQEMTDEGGMFYNMQAKIADTLSGRWGNLKDAWEIMLGSLADSESLMGTVLKTAVEGLTGVIRHLTTISGLIGGMAAGKMLSGLGLTAGSVLGSTRSMDQFYLKAKQLQAIDLQRESLTRQLNQHERAILTTKTQITAVDRATMIRTGQMDKYQTAMLIKQQSMTRVQMMRAALEAGMTKEEIRQLAVQQAQLQTLTKGQLIRARMSEKIGNFFGGFNWASLGITAGIMAAGAAIGFLIQKHNELVEAQKKVAEEAKSTNEDIYKFISTNKIEPGMDAETARRTIEKYDEELKKVSPNYIEIKTRIVGEHGESPQEQAKAYRIALIDAMNGAYKESEKGVANALITANDLNGWNNANDLFNEEAKMAQRMREAINSLAPQRILGLADSMKDLDDNTRAAVRSLVEAGRKVDAIRTIMEASGTTSFNFLGISGDIGMSEAGYTSEQATDFIQRMADMIRMKWSEYFEGGQFQEGKEMASVAKESILQALRNYVSASEYDEQAGQNFIMSITQNLFGNGVGAAEILAEAFTKEYAGQKDAFIKAAKAAGDKLPPEYEAELHALANSIAFSNGRFRESVNSIFADPMTLVQSILIKWNVDTHLEKWQEKLIEDFGDQYAATIKASPDIPSALEAITKLYKEARDKVNTFKPLMLQMGVNIKTPAPLQTSGSWWENLFPWQREAVNQYNEQANFIDSFKKNQEKYSLKEPSSGEKKPKKTGGKKEDKELQSWQRHVELYKKFLDQYRELTKMYGEKEALDKLQKSKAYEWIVSFARARGLDATDIDSMNEALNSILDVNKGDKQKRKDAMAKRTADIEAEGYKRAGEALKRLNDQLNENLKRLNDQYDAYLKIFQITGNKEGAMQLAFGGNVTNERYVDELTEQLRDALKTADWSGTIDDALEMTKEKVNQTFGEESEAANLINKLKEERNKLEKEYIDILANALTSDMSLEDKRTNAVQKYNEELRKLIELRDKANTEEAKAQAQAGIDALTRTHNRNMAGYDTKIYERDMNLGGMMNNLASFSTYMLTNVRDRLEMQRRRYEGDKTDEGIAEYNRITEQINKITDVLTERGGLFNMFKDAFSDANEDIYIGENGMPRVKGATAARYGLKEGQQIDFDTEERIRNMEKMRKLSVAIDKTAKAFKDIETVLKPVIDLFDALGMEDSAVGQGLQVGSNALSAAGATAGAFNNLAQAAGPDSPIGSLLSKAGPYGAAAAAALSVATSIFQLHDKALQKEIEASEARQKEMQDLSDNLERILERALGGIYTAQMDRNTGSRFASIVSAKEGGFAGFDIQRFSGFSNLIEEVRGVSAYTKETVAAMKEALKSGTFYDANYASLLAQRDEMQRQLDLERQKKKKDNSAISDLKQQLIEVEDTLEYYAIDMAKQIYDIDIKSWANELAETIVDAWSKGEDAVEAYKNKVKEMMRSLAVNIVAQKVMEPLLKPVEEFITNEMNSKNGRLDEYSIIGIGNLLMQQTDEGVRVITGILDRLKDAGWDLRDASDNASTLGKGIASITEDTADLLASYINAIRADVAAMRALEERILESGFSEVNSNLALQLTELRNISAFAERNALAAERILDVLDSVTTVGSNGRRIRV